jgi:ribosome recycling factor
MAELDVNEIKTRMEKAIDSFKKDLSGLRVGRASLNMLDQINVNAYGSIMPLNQVSTVSVPESRMLLVSVWDNSLVSATEKSIKESPLGLNPMVEGNIIRISIPPLSEERRIEITKIAAKYGENARVSVRNIRRDHIETVRKLQKNGEISEDQKHKDELSIQEITNQIIEKIDSILSVKEKEILEN